MLFVAGGGSEATQPLSGSQLSWSSESDLLHQLRLLHRVPPLAQDGLKGSLTVTLCTSCVCVHSNTLCFCFHIFNHTWFQGDTGCVWTRPLVNLSLPQVAHDLPSCPPFTVSDCLPEGELSRCFVLQPGGTARSAVLQPGPHPPQSQKQLHVAAQRCSSTHQVCFCQQQHTQNTHSLPPSCVFRITAAGGVQRWKAVFCSFISSFECRISLSGLFCLGELTYDLKRKKLRSNYRWRVCGWLCGSDD